jgi:hypothetical protein
MESHIEFSMQGYGVGAETRCEYIDSKYIISIDDDGELDIVERGPSVEGESV